MNHGISILHGPHHVAQKSSSTTLPLSEVSFTGLFSTSFSVKLKFAGFAFAGHAVAPGPAAVACVKRSGSAFNVSSASARHATAAIVHRMRSVSIPQSALRDPQCHHRSEA